jgi:fucose permease
MAALANDQVLFIGALFVLGGGNSVLDVSMNAHAARVESEYGRPIFAGFHAFWNIGGIAGSGLAAVLASLHVSIAVEFPATGLLLLAASWWAIGTRFLRGADRGQGGSAFTWPSRVLLPLGVIAFCGFVTEGTVNDWSAVYLTNIAGAAPALASLGYFVFSVAMIAVRLVADRLAARIGVARFIRAAALVAVAGLAVVMAITTPVVDIFGFGVVGLGVSAVVPLAWSAAGKRQPASPGKAISAVATFGYLGFLLGPVMIGSLSGLVGLRLALIGTAAATGVICFLAPAMGAAPGRISRRPAPGSGTGPR